MAGIALLSGPQDPSQLDAQLNTVITNVNGYLLGLTPTYNLVSAVTSSSTATIQNGYGYLELNSTRAKTYKVAAPQPGIEPLYVFNNKKSTAGQTLAISSTNTSKFILNNATNTQLTFKTKGQAVVLIGVSSSRYLAVSNIGSVTT